MEGYVVSLNDNILSVSLVGGEVFQREVSISGTEKFAEELGSLILDSFGEGAQKLPLNFLVSHDDVVLSFLTESKKDKSSPEEKLEKDIAKRLAAFGLTPEDVYISHQKIAPFVEQLVAVKKDTVEYYMEVGELMEFEVASIVPWLMLLPKSLPNPVDPKIFVLNLGDKRVLVLSELGGIYYVGSLTEKKAPELKKLVKELSVYERSKPINEIYLFGLDKFDMGDDYRVENLNAESINEFYTHEVAEEIIPSQSNILNSLSRGDARTKTPILKYIGIVLIALGLVLGAIYFIRNSPENVPAEQGNQVVTPDVPESTESTETQQTTPVTDPNAELNKAYLRIRIENGTGLAGLAGRTRTFLDGLGYETVSVGDAAESDREVTLVRFTEENALYSDLLSGDLLEMYTNVEIERDLEEGLGYDVLIIAGTNER